MSGLCSLPYSSSGFYYGGYHRSYCCDEAAAASNCTKPCDAITGRAVQVDPMKPSLKSVGTKRLELKYYKLLSSFAFNFNLRRYTLERARPNRARESRARRVRTASVGRCKLNDPMKPKVKPPETKRLKLKCDILLSTSAFKFNLRRYASAGLLAWAARVVPSPTR